MVERIQQPRSISNRILYVVSLNHFINDGSTFLVSSLFPAMELAFKFSIFQIGILVAVGYLINMIFQPLTGSLTQKFEARILLITGILSMAFSMILFAVSSTFSIMLVSVVILRFGSSFFHPVGASVISRNYSGAKLDGSMGFESAFGNLGIVLAFVSSAPAYLLLGWTGPFLIYAVLEIATVLITLFSLRSNKKSVNQQLKPILENKVKDQINNGRGMDNTRRGILSKFSAVKLPAFFIVTSFISGGSNAIFGNFGNLLLFSNGFLFNTSNDLMAIWVASAFVGAIATGWMTKKFTRMRLLSLAYLVSGICTLAFALLSHNMLVAIATLLIVGFALSVTYPATYSELSDYVRSGSMKEGASFGVLFSSQIAGASILGFFSGFLAKIFTLQASFEIAALLLLVCTIMVFIWSGKSESNPHR